MSVMHGGGTDGVENPLGTPGEEIAGPDIIRKRGIP